MQGSGYCRTSFILLYRKHKILVWFENRMVANPHFGFDFVVCEVLFGFQTHSVPDAELLNFLILLRKWYINHSKTKEKTDIIFDSCPLYKRN